MPNPWNMYAAELVDTRRNERIKERLQPCIYCSKPTRAISRVCLDHDDLPAPEVEATLDEMEQRADT